MEWNGEVLILLKKIYTPKTVEEVLSILNDNPEALIHAGGTDVVPALKSGRETAETLVDLSAVNELKYIKRNDDGSISIGSGSSLSLVEAHPLTKDITALRESVAVIGSKQIRNRGTLTGNICNASPAADSLPALVVLDAELVILGSDYTRSIAVHDFITAPGKTQLKTGELVSEIKFLDPSGGCSDFQRLSRRAAVDLATVSAACFISGGGEVRISAGAVSPVPLRFTALEQCVGDSLKQGKADLDIETLLGSREFFDVNPISDIRAGREYRLDMCRLMIRKAVSSTLGEFKAKCR